MLANEGADVAAHDMIRRAQDEAEGFERLAAEYLMLATAAQAQRRDALLEASGLTHRELDAVRASDAHGPLLAAFREAEAAGLDIEAAFPQLVALRSLHDADDEAAVLHARVHRWMQAASGRRRGSDGLIAGLIPRARGVSDPDLARALSDRERAMEERARTLAIQAIEARDEWVQPARAYSERSEPPSTLAARGLDHRGLPGSLEGHWNEDPWPSRRSQEH